MCHNWVAFFFIVIPTIGEEQLSVNNGGAKWKDGKIVESVTLTLDSKVRLLRHGVIRYI